MRSKLFAVLVMIGFIASASAAPALAAPRTLGAAAVKPATPTAAKTGGNKHKKQHKQKQHKKVIRVKKHRKHRRHHKKHHKKVTVTTITPGAKS